MRRFITVLALCVLSTAALAQTAFDGCVPLGPLPSNPVASCEGTCSNNVNALTSVSALVSCGFPTSVTQYAQILANGPIAVPPGGPVPRPLGALCSEVRVAIPPLATTVTFSWEFFNAETSPSESQLSNSTVDPVMVDWIMARTRRIKLPVIHSPPAIETCSGGPWGGGGGGGARSSSRPTRRPVS